MINADSLRLASPATQAHAATSLTPSATTLFGRFGALLTRLAQAAAPETSDEGVWRSVARGL